MVSRRNFIKTSAFAGAVTVSGGLLHTLPSCNVDSGKITIKSASSKFEREPLIRPFGFKGVYQNEFWVASALIESTSGLQQVGLQTQCLAWSDLEVFLANSEFDGNMLLIKSLDYALQMIKGQSFNNPIELQDAISAVDGTVTGLIDHMIITATVGSISSRTLFKNEFSSNTIGFRCISEIFL